MGIKRIVDTSFWTDGKVDEFSPEDKYFMLYLLTNPFAKQLGIYEISIKQAAFQMGYSVEAFNALIDRFENKYNMIIYSKETNEIAIKNYLRHSVMKGGKPVEDCIKQDMEKVKNKALIGKVFSKLILYDDLNTTVKKIIDEYDKDNDIHNDNDNDRSVDVSYHDTPHDTYHDTSTYRQHTHFAPPKIEEVSNFDLERCWKEYPNKKGKSKITKKALKELDKLGTEKVLLAIRRYKTEIERNGTDMQYIQHGSTFFNGGYLDYLSDNWQPPERKKALAMQKQTAAHSYDARSSVDYSNVFTQLDELEDEET